MTELAGDVRENTRLVALLEDVLTLMQIDDNIFEGTSDEGFYGRLFGGQIIAQALQAAQSCVTEDKTVHSLHAYFMQAGTAGRPVTYTVEREFDGRSFSTRRVSASQDGRPILSALASSHVAESGYYHAAEMPVVPPPEGLATEPEIAATATVIPRDIGQLLADRAYPIEVRPCDPEFFTCERRRDPVQMTWMRAVAPVSNDPALHRAMLAYASDLVLIGTQMLPHVVPWWLPDTACMSLDHAIWIHEREPRVDEWVLCVCDSPWAGNARGINRGQFFSQDGRLLATMQQEGLVRVRR